MFLHETYRTSKIKNTVNTAFSEMSDYQETLHESGGRFSVNLKDFLTCEEKVLKIHFDINGNQ